MLKIGKTQTLTVQSEDSSGFYLLSKDQDEVFLPGTLAPRGLEAGGDIEVFIYIDKKGDQLATSIIPLAEVGDLVCLKVISKTDVGAYLDMGLPKDLFVPNKFIKYPMEVGQVHLVKILLQEESNQLVGTEYIDEFIVKEFIPLSKKQEVDIIPYHKTPLGFKVLIEESYLGMIYHNQIFSSVKIGEKYKGSIKEVRENGQIDVLLHKIGLAGIEENAEKVLNLLKSLNEPLHLSDKSSPDEIKNKLQMSKKSFKAAIGILYKKKLITIEDGFIELV